MINYKRIPKMRVMGGRILPFFKQNNNNNIFYKKYKYINNAISYMD